MAAATTIGQRFLQLIQHLGISKNAFAQSLEKTATVIQHLVDERNKPGYDLLCKVFETYPNVSKDWLLLGQGPMLIPSTPMEAAPAPVAASVAESAVAPAPTLAELPTGPAKNGRPAPGPVQERIEFADLPPRPAKAAAPAPAIPAPAPEPIAAALPPTPPVTAPAPAPALALTEATLSAALHAQYLQHQLALAEQRNQHLLEQQQLLRELLTLARAV